MTHVHFSTRRATILVAALLSALAFVFALQAYVVPQNASALEVTATTAKSNSTADDSIMGGIATRITWEAQTSKDEHIKEITLNYPEGSKINADQVQVVGLDGLKRLTMHQTVEVSNDHVLKVTFPEATSGGVILRIIANKSELPVAGGEVSIDGSVTYADGSTKDIAAGPKINVVAVTPAEQLSYWLGEQGWVLSWNENLLAHTFFDPTIIVTSLPVVAQGWLQALGMVICSFPFAIVLGLVACLMRMSKLKILRAIASIYVNIVRGTPLFLQIYIAFFGLPLLGIALGDFTLSIIVMSINSGAYMCEIFRSGIQAIPKGQFEASRSLGMNAAQTMFYVIIPQAFRQVIPTMTNEFILLYKDTSLFAAVGVMEMIMFAKTITATTGNMTPYIVAALFYLVVTLPLSKFVGNLEKSLSEGNYGKKREKRLVKQRKALGAAAATDAK